MSLVDNLCGIPGPWICLEPKPVLNTNAVMSQLILDAFPEVSTPMERLGTAPGTTLPDDRESCH
jgi:hypothetical protein